MTKESTVKNLKVLLVDDNPRVRSFVRPALEDAGFDYVEAENGWSAFEKIEEEKPNLIVLDIMLSDDSMSGLDVCKKIRQNGNTTPVIFLTIKDRSDDPQYMERAFKLGANDYVSKREELRHIELNMGLFPTEFVGQKSDVEELVTRIKARLFIQEPDEEFDDYLRIDSINQTALVKTGGQWHDTHLTVAEFSILKALINASGRPVGKTQLIETVKIDGEGSLQNHIWRLRNKVELNPQVPVYIQTYHGVGYRFKVNSQRNSV